jgi:hypothetical protein
MKTTLIALLVATTCSMAFANTSSDVEKTHTAKVTTPWYKKPELIKFVEMCAEDEANNYRNAEEWLKKQKFDGVTNDQMFEVLSGFVFYADKDKEKARERARRLLAWIKSPSKKAEILAEYDDAEREEKKEKK